MFVIQKQQNKNNHDFSGMSQERICVGGCEKRNKLDHRKLSRF